MENKTPFSLALVWTKSQNDKEVGTNSNILVDKSIDLSTENAKSTKCKLPGYSWYQFYF